MDHTHHQEMLKTLKVLIADNALAEKEIYLFGHCNATEELADEVIERGYSVKAILDNNPQKQGGHYKGIPVLSPQTLQGKDTRQTIVCIASRAYEAMARQLREMNYAGRLEKLVDYNSFAEYSLSPETIARKKQRMERGKRILERIRRKYGDNFCLICPFNALGDVYYAMAYLPAYQQKSGIIAPVIVTAGKACRAVAAMFGHEKQETLTQTEMDELVQAVLFTQAPNAFIAHHDRPYTNLLMKALYVKRIPFEILYRCGVYGLARDCAPCFPMGQRVYGALSDIVKGTSVILAPYAKSVAGIGAAVWQRIISACQVKGYQLYTNVADGETALPGTSPLQADLAELASVVEWAGTFIGIRSGLCDVIRNVSCRKIALFPDCYYSDTRWKVADFFYLEDWENIVVREDGSICEVKREDEENDLIYIGKDLDF